MVWYYIVINCERNLASRWVIKYSIDYGNCRAAWVISFQKRTRVFRMNYVRLYQNYWYDSCWRSGWLTNYISIGSRSLISFCVVSSVRSAHVDIMSSGKIFDNDKLINSNIKIKRRTMDLRTDVFWAGFSSRVSVLNNSSNQYWSVFRIVVLESFPLSTKGAWCIWSIFSVHYKFISFYWDWQSEFEQHYMYIIILQYTDYYQ